MKNGLFFRKIAGCVIFLLFAWSIKGQAQQLELSPSATISLLTVAPSDHDVYTLYGHTALRVQDPSRQIDIVFNYGLFSFSEPNFLYRFTKGNADYWLGACSFAEFIHEYVVRGSKVIEQILNLDSLEKSRVWEALLINNLPQNRTYRYNFFFDNCATRPAALIEKTVNGTIDYGTPYEPTSFRQLINDCTRNHPWQTFGCDLALGMPADRKATIAEMMFLPHFLKEAYAHAVIVKPDGTEKKLVGQTQILLQSLNETENEAAVFCTPEVCCWAIFLLIALITLFEWRKKKYVRLMDVLLFSIAGIAGCILFFLCFISTHSVIWPNVSILWLHPLHLPAAILFAVKRYGKVADCYHFINFAALTLMPAGWYFFPQHLNTAFIPLVMSLWLRSGSSVYRKYGT